MDSIYFEASGVQVKTLSFVMVFIQLVPVEPQDYYWPAQKLQQIIQSTKTINFLKNKNRQQGYLLTQKKMIKQNQEKQNLFCCEVEFLRSLDWGKSDQLQILKQAPMAYSTKKQYKPVNDRAIIPLTLRQLNIELTDDSVFQGQNFFTVSILGRLEHFRRENNANMFLFNDGTGCVEGRINLTSGKMPAFAQGITFEDKYGVYFFVVLKPKFSEGQKKYYIQMIREVTNFNMISKHFSDVILSSLIRKRNA